MANFEIDTTQETVNQALRKIETSDPVHANVYNLLFEQLINNDAFLERLANKMIQKAMVAHVLDSNNANMVLGADQAPALTALIDVERERITRLNSDLNGYVKNSVFTTYKTIGTYSSINTYSTENVSKYRMLLFRITIGTAYFFVFLPVSVIASSSGGGWKHVTQNGYVTFLFTSYTTFRIAEVYDSYFKNITIYAL